MCIHILRTQKTAEDPFASAVQSPLGAEESKLNEGTMDTEPLGGNTCIEVWQFFFAWLSCIHTFSVNILINVLCECVCCCMCMFV